jgi:hypothetical protein
MSKTCPKCNQTKSISEFNKSKARHDGLTHKCKQCIYDYNDKWTKNNKEHVAKKLKEWNINNPYYAKKWIEDNKEHLKQYEKVYRKNRKQNNPTYKLQQNLRAAISTSVKEKGCVKKQSSLEVVGLKSWDLLREHIESQWTDGMTWNNYGKNKDTDWSIDHIIPQSSASTWDDIKKLNHYANLRPMWHIENMKKGDKIL